MISYPDLPEQGDLIAGKYLVEHVLGEGGVGVVVAAWHVALRQRVAIKLLLPQTMDRPDAIARFLREAQAAAAVQSEHVARVLDVGTLENGIPYLVMEHLSGIDLAHLLNERGPPPIPEVIDFILQAGEAIAEAHALGIVHRDLKPGNLFLTTRPDGSPLVKVLDFGLSKSPANESLTAAGVVMGSPQYMPPEQITSLTNVDQRADIWALGAILYRLLTGRYPFPGSTMAAVCVGVLTDLPRPMRAARPEIPEALDTTVLACLQKDLDRRIQSMADLASRLAPFAPPSSAPSLERIRRLSPGMAPAPPEEDPGSATTLVMPCALAEPVSDSPGELPAPAPSPVNTPYKPWRLVCPPSPAPPRVESPCPTSPPPGPWGQTEPIGSRGADALVAAGVGGAVIGILAIALILFVLHQRSATAPAEARSQTAAQPSANAPPHGQPQRIQGTF
jgi:serine/threonine-protein kinase